MILFSRHGDDFFLFFLLNDDLCATVIFYNPLYKSRCIGLEIGICYQRPWVIEGQDRCCWGAIQSWKFFYLGLVERWRRWPSQTSDRWCSESQPWLNRRCLSLARRRFIEGWFSSSRMNLSIFFLRFLVYLLLDLLFDNYLLSLFHYMLLLRLLLYQWLGCLASLAKCLRSWCELFFLFFLNEFLIILVSVLERSIWSFSLLLTLPHLSL